MNEFLEGKKLYGDDFSHEEIKQWYNEEAEGYANLKRKNKKPLPYSYHAINRMHGFKKVKNTSFRKVLGLGSAWGYEFEPIIHSIDHLTIIEPSDHLVNERIGKLIPNYIKPNVYGQIPFNEHTFDLITCFGTLHHIPNVSYVISELIRVLEPNGYLLIREPIISMGDWQKPRKGLTKNERGIPASIFEKEFRKHAIDIVSRAYCFSASPLFQRMVGFLFKRPIHSYKAYVLFDKHVSRLLKYNISYHATRKIRKLGPQSIFYVIRKQ
jgi:SAM-dependent methyltransferase